MWARIAAPIPPNAVLPFLSLARLTVQYDTNMPTIQQSGGSYNIPTGLYDTQFMWTGVLNPRDETKVGIGITSQFPTGTPPYNGTGQYCLGPAVIVFNQQPGGAQYGFLFQQFNSVGGYSNEKVNLSQFQPFFKYYFGTLGIGLSNNNIFTYDWNASKFSNIPLGINISKLIHVDGELFSVFVDGLYNFQDVSLAPRITTQLGISWLLPE